MNEVLRTALDITHLIFNKFVLLISAIIGFVLSPLGYPKAVLTLVMFVILADIITKQYSLIVMNYKEFTWDSFKQAWEDKVLTSRALKNGMGVKAFLYYPILFVAHTVGISPEIYGYNAISCTLYTLVFLVEFTSMLENFRDCGLTEIKPILDFIKKKGKL